MAICRVERRRLEQEDLTLDLQVATSGIYTAATLLPGLGGRMHTHALTTELSACLG